MPAPSAILYWYDFVCPFCYVAITRNAGLIRTGVRVVELPFEAHPDTPLAGRAMGRRTGTMYAMLEREAREAGLALHWPPRLPNTRLALASAEWVRRNQPGAFATLHEQLFQAHFALGEDLGDPAVILRHATEAGVDIARLQAAIADGSVAASARDTVATAHRYGVRSTPTWLLGERLIEGLVPEGQFEALAVRYAAGSPPSAVL
jgi:predicted DsbA family dithiol-disulfide isomerase